MFEEDEEYFQREEDPPVGTSSNSSVVATPNPSSGMGATASLLKNIHLQVDDHPPELSAPVLVEVHLPFCAPPPLAGRFSFVVLGSFTARMNFRGYMYMESCERMTLFFLFCSCPNTAAIPVSLTRPRGKNPTRSLGPSLGHARWRSPLLYHHHMLLNPPSPQEYLQIPVRLGSLDYQWGMSAHKPRAPLYGPLSPLQSTPHITVEVFYCQHPCCCFF